MAILLKGATRPWLFEAFPSLKEQIPWRPLVSAPTPVQLLKTLSSRLGREIWIKRDDTASPLYGGNKPRKLEFILGKACCRDHKHLITIGGLGTNHGLAVAIFGRELGFQVTLGLFAQRLTTHVQNQLLRIHDHGAKMIYTGSISQAVLWHYVTKKITSPKAYFIAPGGSDFSGILGYVDAGLELAIQIQRGELPLPKMIFIATGSGGTTAGLLLGLHLAGIKTKVIGVQVAPGMIANAKSVFRLAEKTLKRLKWYDPEIPPGPVPIDTLYIDPRHYGHGYGHPTDRGHNVLEMMAETEGLHLDLTYTAKAFGALMDYAKTISSAGPVLFWNTFNSVPLFSPADVEGRYLDLPEAFHRFFYQQKTIT